ncbi:hypothetical protein BZG36_05514 [Bifiguratus adelaidae]|uniref:FHA domain-containing protein n=1 Tax=Bifiguratus adelaidae TaxID=1938954 RepID=A0A261XTI6_9FUNG|nr:hypothetical protein BZG36_05514 [Bifiguratus adelaidae]
MITPPRSELYSRHAKPFSSPSSLSPPSSPAGGRAPPLFRFKQQLRQFSKTPQEGVPSRVGTPERRVLAELQNTPSPGPASAIRKNQYADVTSVYYVSSPFTTPPPQPMLVRLHPNQTLYIGRGSQAHIKLGRGNVQISRIHLALHPRPERFDYVVEVIGMNGCRLDGVRYAQHQKIRLRDGGLLNILGWRCVVQYPSEYKQGLATSELDDLDHAHVAQARVGRGNDKVIETVEPQDLPSDEDGVDEDENVAVSKHNDVIDNDEDEEEEDVLDIGDLSDERERDDAWCLSLLSSMTAIDEEDAEQADVAGSDRTADASVAHEEDDLEEKKEKLNIQEKVKKDSEEDKQENEEEISTKMREDHDKAEATEAKDTAADIDYVSVIIDVLVNSRKSSMTITDIHARLEEQKMSVPTDTTDSKHQGSLFLEDILTSHLFFGKIVRTGKTADGSPKEHLYYYEAERDPVEWRRSSYTQVTRRARKCTLEDKQYFFKMPPKLPQHRYKAYVPPRAGSPSKRECNSDDGERDSKRKVARKE